MIFAYFLSVALAFVSFALGVYIVKAAVLKLIAELAILALVATAVYCLFRRVGRGRRSGKVAQIPRL